jgi:hypothetical protein
MIPKTGDVAKFDDQNIPVLKQILEGIVTEAERTVYMDTVPTAADLELGTKVIYDNGVTRRIYWLTAKGYLGYVTLT